MHKTISISIAVLLVSGCTATTVHIDYNKIAKAFREFEISKPIFDPGSPLLRRRIVLLSGKLNFSTAQTICEQLIYLDDQSQTEPIKLAVNSSGGDGMAYMAIRNTIRSIEAPVDTINMSFCASSAIMLFESATGKRYALEGSIFMIHEGKGSPPYLVKMFNVHLEEILRSRCKLPEEWLPIGGREFILSAEDAMKYQVVDEVIIKMALQPGAPADVDGPRR